MCGGTPRVTTVAVLQTLHIRDLALLHEAEVQFSQGLNAISGETGGGKSLVIAALKLLRGEKGPPGLVRRGAAALRVDGEFALGDGERSRATAELLAEVCDVELESESEDESGLLIVTRIVDDRGRSKVRLNNRPITLAALRVVGAWLLEIHGQGDSKTLMRPDIQAETLDAFGGTTALRHRFREALVAARAARQRLVDATDGERERLARVEFLRYQLREMEHLGLEVGELARLEHEHRVLAHLDHLRELLAAVTEQLLDVDASASDRIATARRALDGAVEIDDRLRGAAEGLAEAEVQVADAARAAQSSLAGLDLDAGRLAQVEERLEAIRHALSRFGPGEAELLDNLAQVRAELAQIDDEGHGQQALEAALAAALKTAATAGRKLTRARAKAAPRMATAIERELAHLSMDKARFRVALGEVPATDALLDVATAHGPAPLDFEVCLNPGGTVPLDAEDRVGRRDGPHRAGAQEVPRRPGSRALPGLRRSRRRDRWPARACHWHQAA